MYEHDLSAEKQCDVSALVDGSFVKATRKGVVRFIIQKPGGKVAKRV